MENFLIMLGVAVGALLLGILFIKRYDRIDRHFFGKIRRTVPGMNNDGVPTFRTVVENDSDYEPFAGVGQCRMRSGDMRRAGRYESFFRAWYQ